MIYRSSAADDANESTQINWLSAAETRESEDNTIFFNANNIPGYLSDVKYFEDDGESYLAMAFYYNSTLNSHNINCLIIKLSTENQTTDLIQTIPSFGAKTLDVLSTEQGIVLIIGNTMNSQAGIETPIYRFNSQSKKVCFSVQ